MIKSIIESVSTNVNGQEYFDYAIIPRIILGSKCINAIPPVFYTFRRIPALTPKTPETESDGLPLVLRPTRIQRVPVKETHEGHSPSGGPTIR